MYRFWPKQPPILLIFLLRVSTMSFEVTILNSYLFFYSFCSTYLWCLWPHYPAITPKCLISTSV